MVKLFETYTPAEIIIFTIFLVLAIKDAVAAWDFFEARHNKSVDKVIGRKSKEKTINDKFKELDEHRERMAAEVVDVKAQLSDLNNKINLLIKSDKDDIKSYIVEKHHYFCNEQGWIDDHSLDVLERRYEHYKDEGGNSFILDLMNEIRALPKGQPKK